MTVAITINITLQIKVSLYFSGPNQYREYSAYNKDLEINLAFLYKYQYIGIKVNSNMKERLLIKCDTTIYADEITNLLIENNIVSRQHDEGQDQNPGAYGAITGIAIYVFEKDYEKAVEIINPIIDSRNESHVWCPKCGSYNVSTIAVSNNFLQ